MSKYMVVMNKQCDFCQGINGFCDKAECRGKSCPGMLDNRPAWCPIVEIEEADIKYINVRRERYERRRLFCEAT